MVVSWTNLVPEDVVRLLQGGGDDTLDGDGAAALDEDIWSPGDADQRSLGGGGRNGLLHHHIALNLTSLTFIVHILTLSSDPLTSNPLSPSRRLPTTPPPYPKALTSNTFSP